MRDAGSRARRDGRIAEDARSGVPVALIARTFGLSPSNVYRILAQVELPVAFPDFDPVEVEARVDDDLVDVAPGFPDVECVYFVQEEGTPFVKIGVSSTGNFSVRLGTLQNANPRRLHLRRLVAGGYELERALHERFAAYRVRGEWFLADGELLTVSRSA